MKRKILFIYPNQFGYHTDTYKYCDHLRYKYDIIYICFDQGFDKLELPGVRVIYIPYFIGRIKRLIRFYSFTLKFTRDENIDILFTVEFRFNFIIGLFGKARLKILDYRTGDLSPNSIKRFMKNLGMRFDALFFRNISVISEGLRDLLFLNKNRTFILPLGADILSNQNHYYDRLSLLYVGTFESRNITQTIEGVAMFLNKYGELKPVLTYTIIGFGNKTEEEIIRNSIIRFGLSEYVFFKGRKKYVDLAPYFDTCNIGVSYVPLRPFYQYQPATKTFEYVLSGLYTIATDTFENRKVINSINGVLCKDTPESFSHSLEIVYKSLPNIHEADIRESLKNYLWRNIVENMLDSYLISEYNRKNSKHTNIPVKKLIS